MKKLLAILLLAVSSSLTAFAVPPAFPGGEDAMQNYISTNLKYPAPALQNGIEGIVNVQFDVRPDGSIGSIKIMRMIDPDLEQEAIRLVKNMPAWTPGDEGITITLPIRFSLPDE